MMRLPGGTMLKLAMIAFVSLTPIQAKKAAPKTTDSVVKVTAKAEKPAADGSQKVTVTVKIDKDYHIYANAVGNPDLEPAKTVLTIADGDATNIEYPKGKTIVDKVVGDYVIYEKEITITAKIKRKAGATGAFEASVKCQACTDRTCLPVATIKAKVDMP
jgi:thiol:disulfide interchange protein